MRGWGQHFEKYRRCQCRAEYSKEETSFVAQENASLMAIETKKKKRKN
jgi:hypothetical protein